MLAPSTPPAIGLRADKNSTSVLTIAVVTGGLSFLLVVGLLFWYCNRHLVCHVALRKSRTSNGSFKMGKAKSIPSGLGDDDLESGQLEQALTERLVHLGLSPSTVGLALGSSFMTSPRQGRRPTVPTPKKAKSMCCIEGAKCGSEKARGTPIYHTAEADFFALREGPTTDSPSLPGLPFDLQNVRSPLMMKYPSSHV